MKEPRFVYRAYDRDDVPARLKEGWVRCTQAEVDREWYMSLGDTFEAAGLVGLKRKQSQETPGA